MSRLHNEEAEAGGYNFEAVRNNDNRIDGGLAALDELYIPINADSAHWNFILLEPCPNSRCIMFEGYLLKGFIV